jgi:hypothetical protein
MNEWVDGWVSLACIGWVKCKNERLPSAVPGLGLFPFSSHSVNVLTFTTCLTNIGDYILRCRESYLVYICTSVNAAY